VRRNVALVSSVLGIVAAGAGTLIVGPTLDDDPMQSPSGSARHVVSRQASPNAAVEQLQQWMTVSLARPLFVPDRRPAARSGDAAGTTALPRLSGILITPSDSSAIFTAVDGKPEVVTKGGRVGDYLVQSISVGEVVLIGPDGRQVLHPTFNQVPRGAGMSAPALEQTPIRKATP
jgi:hypothetical protein